MQLKQSEYLNNGHFCKNISCFSFSNVKICCFSFYSFLLHILATNSHQWVSCSDRPTPILSLNSDLQRWRCRPRSVLTDPLSPPSSPPPPRWLWETSGLSGRSAGRCFSVSAGCSGDSRWRRICSGCRSDRWWYRSAPRRCPAPEPSCRQEEKGDGFKNSHKK